MEGKGNKKNKKNRPGADSGDSGNPGRQQAPAEGQSTQPAGQAGGSKGKKRYPQGAHDPAGGDTAQGQRHEPKQQQPTGGQQVLHASGDGGDGEPSAPKEQGKQGNKKDWKQKKQSGQQQKPSAASEQEVSGATVGGDADSQQSAPQGKKEWKQKLEMKKQQEQPQRGQQQQDRPQQSQQQQSQRQQQGQKQQGQRQQQNQQQQQEQKSDTSGAAPKLTYKQKQLLKKASEPEPEREVTPPTPTSSSSHSSSPSHAAALEPVMEDFTCMKIDKQKIHSSNLVQVLERPNAYGKEGKKISLEVNYIQLLVDRLIGSAYHYDVDIKPPASRKWQRSAFAAFIREMFPGHNFAFDGNKNAYSAKRLKADHYECEIKAQEDNRERKFTVTMKEAAVVDISCLKNYMKGGNFTKPMAAIQCLDVVLRTAYENNPQFVKFKKSIYAVPRDPENIGANHELWYGLFQSALLGSKPFLNVDVSHKAFPSGGPILTILSEMNRSSIPTDLPSWLAAELNNYLKGMEISYTGPTGVNKIFKFNRLKQAANKETFRNENGEVMTVEQYFRQQKHPLKYPNLPVMHVGSTIRNILLPIELCSVPRGQALNKKHPDQCTQMIIRRSATDTLTRKKKIMDIFNQINYNNAPTIKEFGLGVGNAFEKVDARLIDPPRLQYQNNQTVQPFRGVWRADNCNFIVPSTQIVQRELKWVILNLDFRTREDSIGRFGKMISDIARKQNVRIEPFSMAQNFYAPRNMRNCVQELDGLFDELKRAKMDLVIVVLPGPGPHGDVYAKVKQKAELQTGLLTQCVKGDTLFKKGTDLSTINNIWLKINAKTNGSNHYVVPTQSTGITNQKVMYIGADVTHPSPEQTNIPSVVGVAASYDLPGFRYNCCYRLQNAKDEMIRDLENIVNKQIQLFYQQNKILPDLIMYYRDGVSEGQFAEILTIELRAIHAAAARIKPGYKPEVTFIVVQKRHHARFFPVDRCPTEGRNNNVPPGTIVDRHITAPNQYQFFLVSHAAVQGVAKPTKYCVLYDDHNWNPDHLQALTYNLCHMFARCNRAVSYPAPTYYAHLAAYRGRVYIKDRPLNMDKLLQEYQRLQIRTEIIDGHPMFFV